MIDKKNPIIPSDTMIVKGLKKSARAEQINIEIKNPK